MSASNETMPSANYITSAIVVSAYSMHLFSASCLLNINVQSAYKCFAAKSRENLAQKTGICSIALDEWQTRMRFEIIAE
jgi:hypothetical protein